MHISFNSGLLLFDYLLARVLVLEEDRKVEGVGGDIVTGFLHVGWIVTYMLLVHKCCGAVVVMLLIFLIDVVAGKI